MNRKNFPTGSRVSTLMRYQRGGTDMPENSLWYGLVYLVSRFTNSSCIGHSLAFFSNSDALLERGLYVHSLNPTICNVSLHTNFRRLAQLKLF